MKTKKQIRLAIISFAALILGAATTTAQLAAGGGYSLDQAVIASGGGQNAIGDNFALDGTIGQPAAGTRSTNPPFSVTGGFWTAQPVAPTVASVTVSGRVLTPDGRGLTNARVILNDMHGNTRTAISSAFGYYSFEGIEAGQVYFFTVISKRYVFAPQVLTVLENIGDLDFAAQSPKTPLPISNESQNGSSKGKRMNQG